MPEITSHSRPDKALINSTTVPDLSVILVNYCRWGETVDLIRRLSCSQTMRSGSSEIVLVDNHSPPDPRLPQLRRAPGVSVRRWKRNFGFARAVNEGARLSQGQWLLLLNPDMQVSETFLDQVMAHCHRIEQTEPSVGIVGLGVENANGTIQGSVGPWPTFAGSLLRLVLPRSNRKYYLSPPGSGSEVDWASGCCLLIRRACLESIHGFDPRFFLYYEDVDFCLRAHKAGWKVKYEPTIRAVHLMPLASRKVSPWLRLLTRYSLMVYATLHWPKWQAHLLIRGIQLEARARKWQASIQGHRSKIRCFGHLEQLAGDLHKEDWTQAERRLRSMARKQNEKLHRKRQKSMVPAGIRELSRLQVEAPPGEIPENLQL